MSRKPGIGASWLDRFACDAFPSDFVVVDGRKRPVPRYYLRALSEHAVGLGFSEREQLLLKRREAGRAHEADRTPARLETREQAALLRLSNLKREIE